MIYLIHDNNLCKCYNVPLPSTIIIKRENRVEKQVFLPVIPSDMLKMGHYHEHYNFEEGVLTFL
jgi:hypothetical protein